MEKRKRKYAKRRKIPAFRFYSQTLADNQNWSTPGENFFLYPSWLLFKFYCCLSLPRHGGGIPLPSRGIVGKNRSARSKTTVRSKKVGPLGSRSGPFTWFPQCYLFICFYIFPKSHPTFGCQPAFENGTIRWQTPFFMYLKTFLHVFTILV